MPFLQDFRSPDGPLCVLAIDTTVAVCSVSMRQENATTPVQYTHRQPLTPGQSRAVLEQVQAVREAFLARSSSADAKAHAGSCTPALAQPNLIAFGSGPGAFTGLRVACGVAQGLALGWHCPVVAVDSLTTLAWQAWQHWRRTDQARLEHRACRIAVVLDVRMQEVAFAVFDPAQWASGPSVALQHWPQPMADAVLCSPEHALSRLRDEAALLQNQAMQSALVLAGDAFKVYPALANSEFSVTVEQPDASAVAELGAIAFRLGRGIDPADAAPGYLRDKVALDRHEQDSLRAARRAQAG